MSSIHRDRKNKTRLQAFREEKKSAETDDAPAPVPVTPTHTMPPPTPHSSAIKKKLFSSYRRHLFESSTESDDESSSSDKDTPVEPSSYSTVNLIVSIQNILSLVNSMKCSQCNLQGNYDFKVTKRLGLSYYISFTCSCGHILRFITGNRISASSKSQMTDLNMSSILAGSLIGVQRRGLAKFFGAMGILPPVQIESYKRYEKLLFESIGKEAQKSTMVAADEARGHFQGDDVTVSIDGTWLTQGFSSLHGVGTIVSAADPPKVLDYELLSRHCSQCAGLLGVKKFDGELYSKLLEEHLQNGCEANYEGSSGGMEGASMVTMFGRSIEKHTLRYTAYIADGDTKNHISISESKPYGDLLIKRKQCINHFSKRMKTRLSTIKKNHGRTLLADKKTIGGKGRLGIGFYLNKSEKKYLNLDILLDDAKIYRMQIYFGKAIRDNNDDLEKMKQAAWAAWYHMASTDESPMHDLCNPEHCHLYLNFDYKHEGHSLPAAVCAAIKPAYDELCSDDSLRQVLHGGTTNANESFHRIIWSICSKKKYHIQKRIENATNLAVIIYNEGFIGLLPIYRSFGITFNPAMLNMLKKIDHERIKEDKSSDPALRLEQRRRNRAERLRNEAELVEKDPHKYGAGIAD